MFAFLDRNNIGNARIAGMAQDLHLQGDRYEWLITIFYISYILFEFCLLFWKIFPPHIICAAVVFAWQVASPIQDEDTSKSTNISQGYDSYSPGGCTELE